jgi:hypothetical protein
MLPERDIVSLFLNQIYHQSLPPFRFLRELFIFKFINLFISFMIFFRRVSQRNRREMNKI